MINDPITIDLNATPNPSVVSVRDALGGGYSDKGSSASDTPTPALDTGEAASILNDVLSRVGSLGSEVLALYGARNGLDKVTCERIKDEASLSSDDCEVVSAAVARIGARHGMTSTAAFDWVALLVVGGKHATKLAILTNTIKMNGMKQREASLDPRNRQATVKDTVPPVESAPSTFEPSGNAE